MRKYLIFIFILSNQLFANDFDNSLSEECTQQSDQYSICQDGSASFLQPSHPNKYLTFYDGLCGQTGIANLIYHYCEEEITTVADYCLYMADDPLPGTYPKTITYGLNLIFKNQLKCLQGRWTYQKANTKLEFMRSLHRGLKNIDIFKRVRKNGNIENITPALALIDLSFTLESKFLVGYHWVTVLDIEDFSEADNTDFGKKCYVTFNSYGNQYKTSCDNFADWSENVTSKHPIAKTGWGKFTHIIFD